MNSKPLSGIRILDLTRLLPGPLCTLHLADLGADVIKIEDTDSGDYARHAPPLQKNMSTLFLSLNRNKRSLVLDVSKEEGKKIFLRLAERSDVIVESFRPGVMKKSGLDYEEIKKVNPKIIYCSITGYGQTGADKNKAGHDLNFIAESGILYRNNFEKPQLPSFQVGDIVGGTLNAAMSILAAIIHRGNTGKGQNIDVSMFDGALAHSVVSLSHLHSKDKLGFNSSGMLQGDLHCYNIYQTKDQRFIALAALEFKFWQRFCLGANRTEWLSKHICLEEDGEKMKRELSAFFRTKTLSEWIKIFKDSDCCVSPVNTLNEALQSEQAKSRNIFINEIHPVEGTVEQFSFPVKFSNFVPETKQQAPNYGEHTLEILKEVGFSDDEISMFKKEKITVSQ